MSDPVQLTAFPWHEYALVLNAAAYTAVDKAETEEGRALAWAANASAPAALARIAAEHRLTLVHYSTDYVFDGTAELHTEDERYSPLGVYAQTKAAGDIAVATAPRHYIVRTSWVIGDGHNFVRTMQKLAADGVSPTVVHDQVGRLTFTPELSRATRHLVDAGAPYGVYNVQGSGPVTSWADLAKEVFRLSGRDGDDVTPVTTEEYVDGRAGISPRPAQRGAGPLEDRGDRLLPGERPRPAAGLLPPVVVVEAADVVLAEVVAALHLDDHQLVVVEVGDAVRRPDPDVDAAAGLDLDGLAVDRAGRRAGDHDPVLGALAVGLVATAAARGPPRCA